MFQWLTGLSNSVLIDLYGKAVKLTIKTIVEDIISIRKFLYKHFNYKQQGNMDAIGKIGTLKPNHVVAYDESNNGYKQVQVPVDYDYKLSEFSYRQNEGTMNVGEEDLDMYGSVYIPFAGVNKLISSAFGTPVYTRLIFEIGNHNFYAGGGGGIGHKIGGMGYFNYFLPPYTETTYISVIDGTYGHYHGLTNALTDSLVRWIVTQQSYIAKYGAYWTTSSTTAKNTGIAHVRENYVLQTNIIRLTDKPLRTNPYGQSFTGLSAIDVRFVNSVVILASVESGNNSSGGNLDIQLKYIKYLKIELFEGEFSGGKMSFRNEQKIWEKTIFDFIGKLYASDNSSNYYKGTQPIMISAPKRHTPYRVRLSTIDPDVNESRLVGYFIDRKDCDVYSFDQLENQYIPPSGEPEPYEPTEFYNANSINPETDTNIYMEEEIVDPQTFYTIHAPKTPTKRLTLKDSGKFMAMNSDYGYSVDTVFPNMCQVGDWTGGLDYENVKFAIASIFQSGGRRLFDESELNITVTDIMLRFKKRASFVSGVDPEYVTQETYVDSKYHACTLECFVEIDETGETYYLQLDYFMYIGYFNVSPYTDAWAFYPSGVGGTPVDWEADFNNSVLASNYDTTTVYSTAMNNNIGSDPITQEYHWYLTFSDFSERIAW